MQLRSVMHDALMKLSGAEYQLRTHQEKAGIALFQEMKLDKDSIER